MRRSVNLVYNTGEELGFVNPYRNESREKSLQTGSDMSLLIAGVTGSPPDQNVEVLVIAGSEDRIVGEASMTEIPCGVVVTGDDITTEELDGACEGEDLSLVFSSGDKNIDFKVNLLAGDLEYKTDGYAIIELERRIEPIPVNFKIDRIYPNPFNNSAKVIFGVPEAGEITLSVRDLTGRKVYDLQPLRYSAGWHSFVIEASDWASGIYLVELTSETSTIHKKMVLIR